MPGREGHVGATAKDNRLFVEAVLYRYRAGIAWRDLPERFGDPIKIHTRFSRWARSGIWKKMSALLAADADNEYAVIDSTIMLVDLSNSSISGLHRDCRQHYGVSQPLRADRLRDRDPHPEYSKPNQ